MQGAPAGLKVVGDRGRRGEVLPGKDEADVQGRSRSGDGGERVRGEGVSHTAAKARGGIASFFARKGKTGAADRDGNDCGGARGGGSKSSLPSSSGGGGGGTGSSVGAGAGSVGTQKPSSILELLDRAEEDERGAGARGKGQAGQQAEGALERELAQIAMKRVALPRHAMAWQPAPLFCASARSLRL